MTSVATRLAIGTFASMVGIGVACNMLGGTDWIAIRAEWDRFRGAFWPPQRAAEAPKATTPAKPAGIVVPDIAFGSIRLPDIILGRLGHVSGSDGRQPSAAKVRRAFTVFDVVSAGDVEFVTGHHFVPTGEKDGYRGSYCYAAMRSQPEGLWTRVDLAKAESGSAPTFLSLNDKQASALGMSADALRATARESCSVHGKPHEASADKEQTP